MPIYSYKCDPCEISFDLNIPRSEHTKPQNCALCGNDARRVVGPVTFVQKGDGWVGKNQKIKGQMQDKNRRLDSKSLERRHDAPGMRLAPNVGGERVDTWSEAKKLAASKGLNTDSYERKVQQEKRA